MKDTKGKYKPHLVCSSLVRAVARVREYGVAKYVKEDNWKNVAIQDYVDALGRHYEYMKELINSRDGESGMLHVAHIAANAMFIIDKLYQEGEDIDFFIPPEPVNESPAQEERNESKSM